MGGLHGAGLTNMMFMEKRNNILEIRRKMIKITTVTSLWHQILNKIIFT